ncbi:uncharacterized protein TNCV_4176161 [Trichonephila clavipes]|nr:uncharacterized protein TNCV_4176161 [Trichonephila clavipes]
MLPFCPNDFDDNNITKIAARAEESRQLARVYTLRAQDKDRRRYDYKHQMVSYAPRDLVWVYTPAQKAFDMIKAAITKAPVLKLPNFKKPFEIFTDTSSIGVGAVLNQDQRPVVFAFRTLSAAERNYTVTEREGMFSRAVNETTGKTPAELFLGRKLITPFPKLVMVSDGTEFAVNDWVLIKTHPLSSATKKEGAKFKPKFEGPYRVLEVKNNNVVIWKEGKRLAVNVDLDRIHRHRKCDEMEKRTGILDSNSLRDESSSFDRVQRGSNESQYVKYRKQDKVVASTSRYNLRPRGGREVESRPAMEMKTQQGEPV